MGGETSGVIGGIHRWTCVDVLSFLIRALCNTLSLCGVIVKSESIS